MNNKGALAESGLRLCCSPNTKDRFFCVEAHVLYLQAGKTLAGLCTLHRLIVSLCWLVCMLNGLILCLAHDRLTKDILKILKRDHGHKMAAD